MFNIDIHIHFCAQTFLVKYIRDSFTVDENTIGELKMLNKFLEYSMSNYKKNLNVTIAILNFTPFLPIKFSLFQL